MQIQGTKKYNLYTGSIDAAVKIHRKYGVKGVQKGLFATMLREMGFCAGFFTFYEFFSRTIKERNGGEISPMETFIAGGITGLCTWSVIYPLDTLKSIAQAESLAPEKREYSGYFNMLKTIVRKYGFKRLYTGLGVCLLRAFPVNAVTFSCYETANFAISELKERADFRKQLSFLK